MTSIDELLAGVDEAFDRAAWHGPTLRGALRGVNAAKAAWRPGRRRHNIWEIVVHAAYWKWEARRRLTGRRAEPFAYYGVNWFERPGRPRARGPERERAWKRDVQLLANEHRKLRAVISRLPASALGRTVHGRHTVAFTVRGVAAHDVYHAGQIGLLKALCLRKGIRD